MTSKDLETICRMWAKGHTLLEIGETIGRPRSCIGTMIFRLRKLGVKLERRLSRPTYDVARLNKLAGGGK